MKYHLFFIMELLQHDLTVCKQIISSNIKLRWMHRFPCFSLSLSLSQSPYHPLLVSLPNYILCPHGADVIKFLLVLIRFNESIVSKNISIAFEAMNFIVTINDFMKIENMKSDISENFLKNVFSW